MMKLALGALMCASSLLPSLAQARDCVPPIRPTSVEPTTDTTYENVGIYQWDEAQQVWVLMRAGYEPFFETETLQSIDTWISETSFYAGSGGGGSGGGSSEMQKYNGHGKDNKEDPVLMAEPPCTLPTTTVTGSPGPSFGGSLGLFWRGQMLSSGSGSRGVARRSLKKWTILSPDNTIDCSDLPSHRVASAQVAAGRSGMRGSDFWHGVVVTVQFRSGMRETYTHLGYAPSGVAWLKPNEGTCSKAG